MKLYYSAGSCSTSCHIILEESGLKYEAIELDWDNPSDPHHDLVAKLNPLGTLPILVTDQGKQLDQNIAIQAYVADLVPSKNLLPEAGTFERAQAMNWLSFVCSDLHKSIGEFFSISKMSEDPAIQKVVRHYMVERAHENLKYVDDRLAGKSYLMGEQFTPADAYAFIVLGWTQWIDVSLTPYSHIQKFMACVKARPAVAAVLKAEGLT